MSTISGTGLANWKTCENGTTYGKSILAWRLCCDQVAVVPSSLADSERECTGEETFQISNCSITRRHKMRITYSDEELTVA